MVYIWNAQGIIYGSFSLKFEKMRAILFFVPRAPAVHAYVADRDFIRSCDLAFVRVI